MFADIINILTMFFITIYKDSRKVKIDRNCVSKCNLYPYFLIQQNLLISGEKMWMSAELKGCVAWFIYFLNLLWVRYNCAKFEHCRICLTDFREGAFLRGAPPPPPHPWAAPKKLILNRVKRTYETTWKHMKLAMISSNEKLINSQCITILRHFGISFIDENKCFPSMYWLPKLPSNTEKASLIIIVS